MGSWREAPVESRAERAPPRETLEKEIERGSFVDQKKKNIYICIFHEKKKEKKQKKASPSRRIKPIKFPLIYTRPFTAPPPTLPLPLYLSSALYRETVCHVSESYSRTVPRKSSNYGTTQSRRAALFPPLVERAVALSNGRNGVFKPLEEDFSFFSFLVRASLLGKAEEYIRWLIFRL